MAASDKLDELTNVMNLLASEVMNLRRLLAGQATPPGQAAPGQAAAGTPGAGGAGGAGSSAQQQGGSGGGQPWRPPFAPPDPTFPTPGAFSKPMSQEALVSLQGRYQRQADTDSSDHYGATANLLGAAGGMVPGAASLSIGMNRLRGLSEAYDQFRRTMWARSQRTGGEDRAPWPPEPAPPAPKLPAPSSPPAARRGPPPPPRPPRKPKVRVLGPPSLPPPFAEPYRAPRTKLGGGSRKTQIGGPLVPVPAAPRAPRKPVVKVIDPAKVPFRPAGYLGYRGPAEPRRQRKVLPPGQRAKPTQLLPWDSEDLPIGAPAPVPRRAPTMLAGSGQPSGSEKQMDLSGGTLQKQDRMIELLERLLDAVEDLGDEEREDKGGNGLLGALGVNTPRGGATPPPTARRDPSATGPSAESHGQGTAELIWKLMSGS